MLVIDLGVVKLPLVMFATVTGKKVLARRHFRREGLGFSIVPGSVREEILLVVGTCVVIVAPVIVH